MSAFLQSELGAWPNFITILIAISGTVIAINKHFCITRRLLDRVSAHRKGRALRNAESIAAHFHARQAWMAQERGIATYCAWLVISYISDSIIIISNLLTGIITFTYTMFKYLYDLSYIYLPSVAAFCFIITIFMLNFEKIVRRHLRALASYDGDEVYVLRIIQKSLKDVGYDLAESETIIHSLLNRK